MTPGTITNSERDRLEALRSCEVLDTAPEESFDRITRLAARLFSVAVASVSLVDADRVWFKSHFGFSTCQVLRKDAFCNHAVNSHKILIIPDARADERFRDFPTVRGGPNYRFYAGAPLVTSAGHILGTLCLLDPQARNFSEENLKSLADLALLVVDQLESRQIAAQLRQSAADYRELFHNSPAGIFRTTPAGEILFANPAVMKMLGYQSLDELRRRNLEQESLVDDRRDWQKRLEANGEIVGHETVWRHSEGHDIDVRESTRVVRSPEGVVLWYEGWAEDISRRKAAEREHRRAQELIEEIFDAVGDLLYVYDPDAKELVFSNRDLSVVLGYKSGEVSLFHPASDPLIHPEDLGGLRTYLGRCSTAPNDEPIGIEFRMRHHNGLWRWLYSRNSVFRRHADGTPAQIIGLTSDITERHLMEDRLRRQEERWSLAMEANNDGLWDWDSTSGLVFHSRRWREMLGLSPVEPVDWEAMLHPEDRERVTESLSRYLSRQSSAYQVEYQIRCGNGSWKWVLARGIAQWDKTGKALRMVGSHSDITPRKQAEMVVKMQTEALELAREKAEAAVRAKSTFLATMSHEIRTPLNGIIGMSGILSDTELTTEQREYLDIIRLSGEALLSVINDVLDFSKIESGRLELENTDFDLWNLLEETAAMVAPTVHARGLELTVPIDPNVPRFVRGDVARLRQVLLNLLSNAVKFTEKGEITLRATEQSRSGDRSVLCFRISDTGIGIPEAVRERIFDPFTQADSSTNRRFGGTGLGLAICRQLTRLMDGEIGLESEPGLGSTFWFTASLEPGLAVAPALMEGVEKLHGKHVLIVDDNSVNRLLLEQLLRRWGMTSVSACDGTEALKCLLESDAQGERPDIALLDFHMPVMDGLMLAASIRSRSQFADLPMILLTSGMDGGQGQEARALNIATTILKPIRRDALLQAMSAAVAAKARPGAEPPRELLAMPSRPSKGHILLTEDNLVNQKVCGLILRKLDYTYETAGNGKEALVALARGTFDAILLDCQMPEMDGFEATRAIRAKEPAGTRIPIIALTANALTGERERCLRAGMDDYISKPIRTELLAASLRTWIPR